jgi:hypothetical protein
VGFEGDTVLLAAGIVAVWLAALVALAVLVFLGRPTRVRRIVLWSSVTIQLAMALRAAQVDLWPLAGTAVVGLLLAATALARWRAVARP